MQAEQDALEFKRLSALDEKSLLKELNKKGFPRKSKLGIEAVGMNSDVAFGCYGRDLTVMLPNL